MPHWVQNMLSGYTKMGGAGNWPRFGATNGYQCATNAHRVMETLAMSHSVILLDGIFRPGARMSTTKRLTLLASLTALSLLAAELSKPFTPQQKRWWAFQKVVKPAVPTPAARDWVASDVDAFVLAKLEEKNLKPSPPADKLTLIRRATLDLTGMLPTPEEVQSFLADTSPGAFAKVVDRLLASPR